MDLPLSQKRKLFRKENIKSDAEKKFDSKRVGPRK